MPTVTEQPTTGYAHCTTARCAGNNQVEVKAIRAETNHSYEDLGGDWPFTERSHVELRFADEADRVCPFCEQPTREVTAEPRKQYAPVSGHDPHGLLDIKAQGVEFNPAKQAELRQAPLADPERERMTKLEAENAELRERMARFEGYMSGQQSPAQPPASEVQEPGDD